MWEWIGIAFKGLFYMVLVALMAPVLQLFRVDNRIDYAEDLEYGYDDNDPGESVDHE